MWKCIDPSVSYLADVGFNVIRLPRSDLVPGDVLAGTGPQLVRVGNVSEIWPSKNALAVNKPAPAALLSGRQTEALQLVIGLSVLGGLLAPLGVSRPKLKAALSCANSISFGFGDPHVWAVTPLALGTYLADADPISTNPAVRGFITSGTHHTHFITDLLTSSSMTVAVAHQASAGPQVDVDALAGAVNAEVKVLLAGSGETVVEFSGPQELAFGFRSIEFEVEKGVAEMRKFAKPGKVFGAAPPLPRTWASSFPLAEVTIEESPAENSQP